MVVPSNTRSIRRHFIDYRLYIKDQSSWLFCFKNLGTHSTITLVHARVHKVFTRVPFHCVSAVIMALSMAIVIPNNGSEPTEWSDYIICRIRTQTKFPYYDPYIIYKLLQRRPRFFKHMARMEWLGSVMPGGTDGRPCITWLTTYASTLI